MKRDSLPLFLFLLFLSVPVPALSQISFSVMSYNVENLFDTYDAPGIFDEEFLPHGKRNWNEGRYYHKLQQIARVITAAGEWDTPALIGLCEVENDTVLNDLLTRTPLKRQQYRFRITHGQDRRGINVALLYQRDKFACIGHTEYPIHFKKNKKKRTRNLLHVWGKVANGHLLDVFVCHFPSRSGGEKDTENERLEAARILRNLCDSIHQIRPVSQIIIMGDFNDTPENASMRQELKAQPLPASTTLPRHSSPPLQLYNLFGKGRKKTNPEGTHKFGGQWNQLDQIIISSALAAKNSSMRLRPEKSRIFAPSFLLVSEKNGRSKRPFRTYNGYKHEGGFSDHLPVIAEFSIFKP